MATYIWKASNYANAHNPLGNEWTSPVETFATSAIATSGDDTYWQLTKSASSMFSVYLNEMAATSDDVEVLARMYRSDTGVSLMPAGRVSTTQTDYLGGGFRNNATETRLREMVNGSTTWNVEAAHNITTTSGAWMWIRTRFVGTTSIYTKVWEDGGTEPAEWTLQNTAQTFSLSSGRVGFGGFFGLSSTLRISWLSVGTGADTAPDTDLVARKITITDLKDPNAANSAIANAINVQVKLWIGKTDTGAPDVLSTTSAITSGAMTVNFDTAASVGTAVLGVAKWSTYFFPIDTTVQEVV